MSKKNDNIIFTKLFILMKEIIDIYKDNTIIDIEIVTIDGLRKEIEINSKNIDLIKLNKNIIVIDQQALCIEDIIKLKILNTNLNNRAKNMFMTEIENIIEKEMSHEYKNSNHYRGNTNLVKEKNIEWYIQQNKKSINTICCKGIKYDGYINNVKGVDRSKALNQETSLEIKRKAVIEDVDINIEKGDVISTIKECKEKVIKDIHTEEKLVLTNNSEEIEVAKPIKVEEVGVVTDIHMDDCKLVTDQSTTKAVKNIKGTKSSAITEGKPIYEKKVIGNINKDIQLIKPKTVDILFVEPSNKNISKEEIKDKYITLDPTGEKYIGVVLDDGTFEPLKVSMKTITMVPNNIKNILANIDENKNIINKVVKDMDYSKANFIDSLEIEYNDNILEKNEESETQISDIISMSKRNINNVLNKDETALVVTKKEAELIKGIKDIEHELVSKIDSVDKVNMVKSVESIEHKNYVVEDAELDKETTTLVSDMEIIKEKIAIPFEEDINGEIKYVGSGVMLVDNNDSGITIYSTSKINAVM